MHEIFSPPSSTSIPLLLTLAFRSESLRRIQRVVPDVLIFADAGQDCRTFALAHYRLAPIQMVLWGWGGTLGIGSIDYYVFPEVFWMQAKCRISSELRVPPQELYSEQVMQSNFL